MSGKPTGRAEPFNSRQHKKEATFRTSRKQRKKKRNFENQHEQQAKENALCVETKKGIYAQKREDVGEALSVIAHFMPSGIGCDI